jgi:methylamine dehydrogenase light chain
VNHNDDHQAPNKVSVDQSIVDDQAGWLAGEGGSATGRVARRLSERVSRRSVLARLGQATIGISGVALVSALPVSRGVAAVNPKAVQSRQAAAVAAGTDPTKCDYWRLCNMDGQVCADCAGGGTTTCPPGSQPGAEYWVGCCTDPETNKTYLMAYYDCCGASGCASTFCDSSQVPDQGYNPVPGGYDQNVVWCVSQESQTYTCTVAPVIGKDCQPKKFASR